MASESKDYWDKLKIIAWMFISVSTLAWTIASWFLLQLHEQKVAERQAQATVASAELQRKVSIGQLAAALMPSLNGTEAERRTGLLILASVAPDIADKVSIGLDQNTTTPDQKQFAESIKHLSKQSRVDADFRQSLENARVYQRFQQYGQADREYLRASEGIPTGLVVDQRKIGDAKSAYGADRFSEAAQLFEEAFQGIASQ